VCSLNGSPFTGSPLAGTHIFLPFLTNAFGPSQKGYQHDRKCRPLSRGASLSFVAVGFWCVRLCCVGSFDLSCLLFTECSGLAGPSRALTTSPATVQPQAPRLWGRGLLFVPCIANLLQCDLACVKQRRTLRYLVKRILLPPSTCPHRPTIQPPVRTHARTCCADGRRLYTGPDCRGLSALRGIHVSNHTATESVQCN
jgi:hypothetical protein